MKLSIFSLSFILVLLSITAGQAQFLTGFGTGDFNKSDSTFTDTQTATSYQIQGSDFGNYLAGTLSTPIALSASTMQLSLQGTMNATNPNSSFDIILQDSSGLSQLIFTGNWSAFTSTGIEQAIIINRSSVVGTFNGILSSLSISTNGTIGTLNFTFDGLSAVPEPTSMLLLGMGLCGLAMRRSLRRR